MEKKKLLLVAVSVGMVLLILISIPLVLLSPGQSPALASHTASTFPDPGPETPSAIEPPGLTQIYDSLPEPQPQQEITELQSDPVPQITTTTITVPAPRSVAVPDTPARSTPTVAAPRPAPAQSAPARPEQTARAQPAPRPAQAEPVRTHTSYWVQTGAFSTKVRAEGVKESLEAKGITSIVENRDIDGRTWYRVRVGPYISENEANYWLALVKSIDGFGDSQIRQAQALR